MNRRFRRPHVGVPADQAWYWTRRWHKGERAADRYVAAGRVKVAQNVDEFLAAMDKVRQNSG